MMPDNWNEMSSDEKMEARLQAWISTEGKPFATEEAAALYRERAERLAAIIKLEQPDRVPCFSNFGEYVAKYGGVTSGDMFYDYDKAVEAMIKFHKDFDLDYQAMGNFLPGKVYDTLQYQVYRWPGGDLPDNVPFQCVEQEYMQADEYDALIEDPEGYAMKTYMPRIMPALAGWEMVPSYFGSIEIPFVPFMMAPIAAPPVQAAYKAWLEASMATVEWLEANGRVAEVTLGQLGLPGTSGGFTKAPLDFIGDTLRGTRGMMLDMYRQPDKLIAAAERLTPIAIKMAVGSATANQNPLVLIPLHKGADGFMSTADFAKFYWPSFKALLLGLIEEGVIPLLFVEGGYNRRLEFIADEGLPAGKTVWMFDQTDMADAKKYFGDWACIGGNVPASLFKAGTPEKMSDYIKKLIDTAGPGGGYFVAPGAVIDDANPENVHAYFKTTHEYGVY